MNMTSLSSTILIHDPAGRFGQEVSGHLRSLNYIVLRCAAVDEVLPHLENDPYLVFADASTPKFEAQRLLAELHLRCPDVPVVLGSGDDVVPNHFGDCLTAEFGLLMLPASPAAIDHAVQRARMLVTNVPDSDAPSNSLDNQFVAMKSHADKLERHNVKLQREHAELSKAANRQRAELKEQEASRRKLVRVRGAVDSARDGMLILDIEGRVEYSNPAFDEMFGVPQDVSGPYSLDRIFVDRGMASKVIDNVSVLGTFTVDVPLRHRNDGQFPAVVHANRIDAHDADFGGILLIFSDITEQERLRHEAQFDALTGSYGRRYFLELLSANTSLAGRHNHGLALVMCDLDMFKEVNDTHGHRMGDKVLMTFAEVVRSEVRQEDVLGRFGGDEFMILFPHVEAETVISCLERIRLRLEEIKFRTDTGDRFSVSVTMGVADYVDSRMSEEEYIELADQSLYLAKEVGRNCIVANGKLAQNIAI